MFSTDISQIICFFKKVFFYLVYEYFMFMYMCTMSMQCPWRLKGSMGSTDARATVGL